MGRIRRTSEVLEIAKLRLAGLKEINPKPDFGPGLTPEAFEAAVNALNAEQDAYNGALAELDDKTNLFDSHEQAMADFNSRILGAVRAIYGADSSEYELVGGVRRSDRKKPARETKPPTA